LSIYSAAKTAINSSSLNIPNYVPIFSGNASKLLALMNYVHKF